MSKAHIPPAVAIIDRLKQFVDASFLSLPIGETEKKKKNKGTSIFWLLVFGVHNRSTLCVCVFQVSTLSTSQIFFFFFFFFFMKLERMKNELREE